MHTCGPCSWNRIAPRTFLAWNKPINSCATGHTYAGVVYQLNKQQLPQQQQQRGGPAARGGGQEQLTPEQQEFYKKFVAQGPPSGARPSSAGSQQGGGPSAPAGPFQGRAYKLNA
jgi:hypothetical protein